jgi:hypothetical protein
MKEARKDIENQNISENKKSYTELTTTPTRTAAELMIKEQERENHNTPKSHQSNRLS